MALKCLLNKTADRLWTSDSVAFSLYSVAPMLNAMYMDCYFDADKKQGLCKMLHTQLDKMETDTVTVRTKEDRPWTDRAETSLLDMYDDILVESETTEQINNETASKWNK